MDLFFTNIAYASSVSTFMAKVDKLIINPLILFLFALALVYFFIGLFEFLLNQDKDDKKTEGRSHMIWGIIGITIMMGVWTILSIITNTFNITGINPQQGTVKLNDYNPTYPALTP